MRVKGELVDFVTRDGFALHGFLLKPKNSKICVINVHGMTGNFYGSKRTYLIARRLNKAGVAFFSINTRGHDASALIKRKNGRRFGKIIGTNTERFEDCVSDIQGAINELKRMGFRRFILSGHSTGCQKVAYYQYKTQNRNVDGLLLLSPGDDYNGWKRDLGRKFGATVSLCKAMVRKRHGDETNNKIPFGFSARRFLSIADPRNAEARMFNYDGKLHEFSKIRAPMCVVFGSREQHAVKPVRTYLNILLEKTNSKILVPVVIKGAKHSLENHEAEAAKIATDFVLKVARSG